MNCKLDKQRYCFYKRLVHFKDKEKINKDKHYGATTKNYS